ncbi:F-box domain-containing protein [Mycena chlorophos]|uniref:F-box domain-containing protein n=1 Tax=Mycena chlorophos TaxID=658473 RepID=A0A8H6VZK3_MYCCL|nr:F-box domain-containing protein [Mycena chlorophos]
MLPSLVNTSVSSLVQAQRACYAESIMEAPTFSDILCASPAALWPLLAEAEAALANIDEQIEDLHAGRGFVLRRLAALKYASSPIGPLRAELLSEIFLHAIELDRSATASGCSSFKTIVQLASVCTYWRQVALGNARLWQGEIRLEEGSFVDSEAELAGLVLRRSWPSSVFLDLRPLQSSRARYIGIAHRWPRVFIEASFDFDISSWLSSGDAASAIHRLRAVVSYQAEDIWPHPNMRTIFLQAPKLSRVSLTADVLNRISMPWSRLVSLKITHLKRSPQLFNILAECTSLRFLDLALAQWVVAPRGNTLKILPALEELKLYFSGKGITTTPLFSTFAFPVLRRLELYLNQENPAELGLSSGFAAFLGRSLQLVALEIWLSDMTAAELNDVLFHTPSLESLHLCGCQRSLQDDLFERLTYHPIAGGRSPVVPRLQFVHFEDTDAQFTPPSVMKMVNSRWWADGSVSSPAQRGVTRLKEFFIFTGTLTDVPEFSEWAEELSEQGLDIEIN